METELKTKRILVRDDDHRTRIEQHFHYVDNAMLTTQYKYIDITADLDNASDLRLRTIHTDNNVRTANTVFRAYPKQVQKMFARKFPELAMKNAIRHTADLESMYVAEENHFLTGKYDIDMTCLLYTSPSPRDRQKSRMPSSA